MDGPGEARFDLTTAKAIAVEAARMWGLELGEPFALSNVSFVAPAGRAVLKVPWEGDQESLHEGEALDVWDGDGATKIAIDVASRLWRRAGSPFRPVEPEVMRWLDNSERDDYDLVPLARQ